ncbi:unnamed protein product [Owenia fusiformis]|uniref:Exonuclease domain-containing protein n=1 Tax=Owenia fusiformis TaxID=6347 RepID=A0A8S4NV41_OWEFU|nr:unnamed protein product [Owenia fusiformis]
MTSSNKYEPLWAPMVQNSKMPVNLHYLGKNTNDVSIVRIINAICEILPDYVKKGEKLNSKSVKDSWSTKTNGEINKMNKDELRKQLTKLKLDSRGVKEVLKKRLKNHNMRLKLRQAEVQPCSGVDTFYEYLLVIDFEATCMEDNPTDYKHEIIEFPIVLIHTETLEIIDEYHSYVRPEVHPQLTRFCSQLTGISQATVSRAPIFKDVLENVNTWMEKHRLNKKETKFAIITDGPWDMSRFMYTQCQLSHLPIPKWARKWINLRKCYSNYYCVQRIKLASMLENLGMTFEGKPHSGIDDARNIAKIALRMLNDGCELRVNEMLFSRKLQKNSELVHQNNETVKDRESDWEVLNVTKKDAEMSSESDNETEPNFTPVDSDTNQFSIICNNIGAMKISNKNSKKETIIKQHTKAKKEVRSNTIEDEGIDDLLAYYRLQSS